MDVIKIKSLINHFNNLLSASKSRIAFDEISFSAKQGYEEQCEAIIDRISKLNKVEVSREELIDRFNVRLQVLKACAVDLLTDAERVKHQNQEYLLVQFIDQLKKYKEF